jgi:hypothetical protein
MFIDPAGKSSDMQNNKFKKVEYLTGKGLVDLIVVTRMFLKL